MKRKNVLYGFAALSGALMAQVAAAGILPYINTGEESCDGNCIEACVTVHCDLGSILVGGGGYLDVGELGNTSAGDNVALQRNGPIVEGPDAGQAWEVCGRELQNTPGAGGKNADGTSGGQVPSDCSGNPGSCFQNWASSTPPSDGGSGPVSISATGSEWTVHASAICMRKFWFQQVPDPKEGDTDTACFDPGELDGECSDPI